MNKKIFFLIGVLLCLFTTRLSAQFCFGTNFNDPECIKDQHVEDGGWYWYPSAHGGIALNPLNFSNNNAPGSTGKSLLLWSFEHKGQGAYTCYNFQKDSTYTVCFWIRHIHPATSGPPNWFGKFKVYAAEHQFTSGTGAWAFFNEQFIDSSYGPFKYLNYGQTLPWEFVSATFTADSDYNALLLYPDNPVGAPPPGNPWLYWNVLYEVEVDDIRVHKVSAPANITVTGNNTVISSCGGQAQLFVNGMPPNTIATWNPAPASKNANGSVVTVSPCKTTVYEVIVTDTLDSCANCLRKVLRDTIIVDPWPDSSYLVYPTTVVPCVTGIIDLDYIDPAPCAGATYQWVDPQGNTYPSTPSSTTFQSISPADATHTGEWTLRVTIPSGCVDELKFPITVGSCCISSPDFTFNNNTNPMSFTYTGTGITNLKSTLWNFGDGNSSTLNNPIHTFNTPKDSVFTVCLTTLFEDAQGEGCCNQKCTTVKVPANPNTCIVNPDFSFAPISGWGNTFNFTDLSSGSGTICDYFWDFDDGTPVLQGSPSPRHQFVMAANPGPWKVCLTVVNCVYDAGGNLSKSCTATKCQWVYPVPTMPKPGTGVAPGQNQAQPPLSTTGGQGDDKRLTVYPNPNSGSFSLNLDKRAGNYTVVIRDVHGREVYNREQLFNGAPVLITLNDVSDGVYSVEVKNGREKFIQQVSITR